jgi:cephalosporin-C deacetylase-like acetyl esterase
MNVILYKAGAVVDPYQLRPCVSEPEDFDAFWAEQKKKLAALPMNAKLTPVPNDPTANAYPGPEVESFDVQADCLGGAPLSGYLSRPKNAKPKSLPATIHFHSAGVHSSDLKLTTALAKGNQLGMDINAHGIPNGRPEAYYTNLAYTTLRSYGDIGLESRETSYLLGMYLRIMRSIEFLASQPEWDGKTIIAEGTSQGGGQALIAAGLDARVTLFSAGCPTFCNLAASSVGQAAGFPFGLRKLNPKELATVRYFDACYHIKRAKAAGVFRVGVIDEVCWPAGMFAAYNLLPGKKFLVTAPTTHSPWCSPDAANKAQAKDQEFFRALRTEELKR